MQIKLEHLLIAIIILFGLYLLMDRCRCNGNRRIERFSISTSALKTYLETFGDEKYVDYREQIINDMNEARYLLEDDMVDELIKIESEGLLPRYMESTRQKIELIEEGLRAQEIKEKLTWLTIYRHNIDDGGFEKIKLEKPEGSCSGLEWGFCKVGNITSVVRKKHPPTSRLKGEITVVALNKLDLLSMIKCGQNDKNLPPNSTLFEVGWSRGSFLWMGRIIPSADADPERPDYYGCGGEHYQWWLGEMDKLLAGSWGTAAQQRRGLGSGSGSGSPSDDSMDEGENPSHDALTQGGIGPPPTDPSD